MNRAEIIGRLGRDPEVRSLNDGTKVCNLSVATSERYKDRDGNRQEKTEWHRAVLWSALAEIAEKYLAKGSQVYLSGQLQTRKWQDQSGNDRYSTEIVVRAPKGEMEMLGDPKSSEPSSAATGQSYADAKGRDWQAPPDEDEIPF